MSSAGPSWPLAGTLLSRGVRIGSEKAKEWLREIYDTTIGALFGATRSSWIGGNAGPRRMPTGCGAERNGPRLGNTGALPTALRTGVR